MSGCALHTSEREPSLHFFFEQQILPEQLLGVSANDDPLMHGIRTKASLELCNRDTGTEFLPLSNVFFNNLGFPVVIYYGLADKDYVFCMVAIFLVSRKPRSSVDRR